LPANKITDIAVEQLPAMVCQRSPVRLAPRSSKIINPMNGMPSRDSNRYRAEWLLAKPQTPEMRIFMRLSLYQTRSI
jgi:hypothetical protein